MTGIAYNDTLTDPVLRRRAAREPEAEGKITV
jgi:hypothetical protein